MAQTWEQMMQYPDLTKEAACRALDGAVRIVKANLSEFTQSFQSSNSFDGFYEPTPNVEWTTGFWTGVIWLAYEYTKEDVYRKAAQTQVFSFLKRIQDQTDVNHHDMGFLYSPSCVAAYKLTKEERAREAALLAADHLSKRYRERGQFIQAWGEVDNPAEYRLIIDCLLNLPLLYWATEVTKDPAYAQKAERHIKTAMKCIVRPDNSTYHTYFIDIKTGEPAYGITHQGNRNGSAWARGQAWGIYGIALSYRYLREDSYLDLFERVTNYFIEHLPEDLIPYWDFDYDTGSEEPRDSSAAAIAVCGILEMAKYLETEQAQRYVQVARRMLYALVERCGNREGTRSNGLLLYGTYARDSKENTCKNRGVMECNTWGDYFYMEALTRMNTEWEPYW